MPELFGPLPRHAIAQLPLVGAILAPLAAAALAAALGDWLEDRRASARPVGPRSDGKGRLHAAGVIAAAGAAASALLLAAGLLAAAGAASGLVVSPGWSLARIGSFDAVLGLDLDLPRGAVALAIAGLGVAHALGRGGRSARAASLTAFLVAAAVAAVTADGLGTALLALGAVLAATAGGAAGARWVVAGSSIGMLLLGGATLAWSLEGRWLDGMRGNYLSDYGPRFAAVRDAPAPNVRPRGAAAAEGRGTISMTSAPGAEVHTGVSDESSLRMRRAPLGTAPFQGAPVPAVIHKIAVVPGGGAIVGGDGLEIALLDAVDVRAGDDLVIQPMGATLTWRDVDAQLALREADGKHPLRSALAQKRLAGGAAPTVVLVLLFAAALAALLDLPRRVVRAFAEGGRGEAALVAIALAAAAVGPAARAGGLVPIADASLLLAFAAAVAVIGVLAARAAGPWLGAGVVLLASGAALLAVTADAGWVAMPIAALGAALTFALSHPGGQLPPRWLHGNLPVIAPTEAPAPVKKGVRS